MFAGRPAFAAADFPRPLALDLPYDVDLDALRALNRDQQIPEAQRLFDIFAWQCFIALNWPAAADGSPDRNKTIADVTSPRVWMSWRTNDSVFLPDGSRPEPWNPMAVLSQPEHYLWRFSKMLNESRQEVNELSASTQAFTGPLVDQNGVFVRYESYLNGPQFDYIVKNELYNQDGQVAFAQQGKRIEFPANVIGPTPRHGSMSIKLAWKQLEPNDIRERFFVREAVVVSTSYDEDGRMIKARSKQLMGLVGMHITALTQSSPTWIWATFEHIDNVFSNDLEFGTALNGSRVRIRPNFNNPDQPAKQVNVLPLPNVERDSNGQFQSWDEKKTTNPVQLTRVMPIPPATAELNRMVQALLGEQNSAFRYYELVGTQWPVQPGFPAFGGGAGSAPESIYFKVPGRVIPVYLVNTTMSRTFKSATKRPGR